MPKSPRTELFLLLLVGVCFLHAAWAQTPPTTVAVRHIQVLGSKNVVEIEIEASDRVVPETRVLTGPDRLVVDIPNAVPGNQLRSQSVNRGEVKDVRVGLFQANPPTTRVVLDLNSPQSYQIFPYGRTVIIKVTGVAQRGPMSDGHALWKSMGWRAWNIGSRLCLAPSRCADPAAQSDRPRSCRHLQVGLDDGAPLGVR